VSAIDKAWIERALSDLLRRRAILLPMHIVRPISHLRRVRLIAWARLWLVGLSACGAWWDDFERAIDAHLDKISQMIVALIILRVAPYWRGRRRIVRPAASPLQTRAFAGGARRAFIGARLRRALRGRSIGARISALLGALRELEAHTSDAIRRMARGFTRRRPLHAARAQDACVSVCIGAIAQSADTS
jgi:hypothetical protein